SSSVGFDSRRSRLTIPSALERHPELRPATTQARCVNGRQMDAVRTFAPRGRALHVHRRHRAAGGFSRPLGKGGHKSMKRFKTKKSVVALLAVAALAIAAFGAYAYWTQGGSGTGSATAGTTAAVTVVQD